MQFRCILKSDIYVLEEKHTLSGYGGLWKFPSCQMPIERPEGRVCDSKNGPRFRLQGRAQSQQSPWLEEFTMLSSALFQQSTPTFLTPWPVAHQAPLSMGFSRKEYPSGLPYPPPGDLPDSEIEPASLVYPALQADSLPTEPLGKLRQDTMYPKLRE